MTDKELNARLRDFEKVTVGDAREAADRIEQLVATNEALTKELAAAQHDAKEAEAYAEEVERELRDTQDRANAFATKEYYTEMRAERAEAKLAKAVEALEFYTGYDDGPIARATLAAVSETHKIKGESRE